MSKFTWWKNPICGKTLGWCFLLVLSRLIWKVERQSAQVRERERERASDLLSFWQFVQFQMEGMLSAHCIYKTAAVHPLFSVVCICVHVCQTSCNLPQLCLHYQSGTQNRGSIKFSSRSSDTQGGSRRRETHATAAITPLVRMQQSRGRGVWPEWLVSLRRPACGGPISDTCVWFACSPDLWTVMSLDLQPSWKIVSSHVWRIVASSNAHRP